MCVLSLSEFLPYSCSFRSTDTGAKFPDAAVVRFQMCGSATDFRRLVFRANMLFQANMFLFRANQPISSIDSGPLHRSSSHTQKPSLGEYMGTQKTLNVTLEADRGAAEEHAAGVEWYAK